MKCTTSAKIPYLETVFRKMKDGAAGEITDGMDLKENVLPDRTAKEEEASNQHLEPVKMNLNTLTSDAPAHKTLASEKDEDIKTVTENGNVSEHLEVESKVNGIGSNDLEKNGRSTDDMKKNEEEISKQEEKEEEISKQEEHEEEISKQEEKQEEKCEMGNENVQNGVSIVVKSEEDAYDEKHKEPQEEDKSDQEEKKSDNKEEEGVVKVKEEPQEQVDEEEEEEPQPNNRRRSSRKKTTVLPDVKIKVKTTF